MLDLCLTTVAGAPGAIGVFTSLRHMFASLPAAHSHVHGPVWEINTATVIHPAASPACPPSFQHWLTELEIFATIFAAAIHDYEHTGTTNNFHIQTR